MEAARWFLCTAFSTTLLLLLPSSDCSLLSEVSNVPPPSSVETNNSSCQDYTANLCSTNADDGILATINDVPEEAACQLLCAVEYQSSCTFFIYDKQQLNCTLLDGPMAKYLGKCGQYGGPDVPSMPECLDSKDPCKVADFVFINH